MEYIVNAAPMFISRGLRDLSTRRVTSQVIERPTHAPLVFFYAQKGPTDRIFLSPSDRENIFGTETFNLRGKYANHATPFANVFAEYGNNCMYQRIVSEDAGPNANVTLYLDVLPTKVEVYERNTDGSIKLNAVGSPIVSGTKDGYKVKFVASSLTTVADAQNYGKATVIPGNQVDGTVQSQRYPILSFKVPSQGEYGDNNGFRAWAATSEGGKAIPAKMMANERAYPFYFSFVTRPDSRSSAVVEDSIYGEKAVMVTFKKNSIDPTTEAPLYIGERLLSQYNNSSDPRYAATIGAFNSLVVYENNIDTLLTMFHAAEATSLNSFSDFTASADDKYLFNFFSGTTSEGVPYTTYQLVDDVDSVRLTEYTNIYASGGSDGTMSDAAFAKAVSAKMQEYLDPNSPVQDMARNVESIIYDSGFPMATKYDLIKFMSIRKDTFVHVSPYEAGQPTQDASEEHSAAIALRTRIKNYPDSSYYGTPAFRAMITGRSGKIRNSLWTGRLPLTYEIAAKSARYMGAGNGIWNSVYSFSRAPLNSVEFMSDINITWVGGDTRNRNWDVGLNFVLAKDLRTFFFPALKTICSDDTSTMNSYFSALIACDLQKVAFFAWTEYTGADDLTDGQICARVDDTIIGQVKGKYDDRAVIRPESYISDRDALLGFVWTTPIKMYTNNMKTVNVAYVESHRMSDLNTN